MKKKLGILLFLMMLSILTLSAETKVGIIGGRPTSISLSFDNIEIQVGSSFFTGLTITGDYKVYKQDLTLGTTPGFFFNVGVGPYIDLGSGWFGLGLLVPFEFGFNIPDILDSKLDVYAQVSPGIRLVSNIGFEWNAGLGVRYKL